jgi:hypothetical protein
LTVCHELHPLSPVLRGEGRGEGLCNLRLEIPNLRF